MSKSSVDGNMNMCTFQSCKMNMCYSLERNFVTKVPKLDNYFKNRTGILMPQSMGMGGT